MKRRAFGKRIFGGLAALLAVRFMVRKIEAKDELPKEQAVEKASVTTGTYSSISPACDDSFTVTYPNGDVLITGGGKWTIFSQTT